MNWIYVSITITLGKLINNWSNKLVHFNWNRDIWKAEKDRRGSPGTAALWLLNNTYFCYEGETPIDNDNEKTTLFTANTWE